MLVTGTLSPDATGVYKRYGGNTFHGYPLFIKDDAPAFFIFYSVNDSSYVISRTLTSAALTDYWVPTVPITEPTGTYEPQGAVTGTATGTDNPVDLTGYTPKAEVRRTSSSNVVLDLNPSVTDGVNGEVTIPAISSSDTQDFDFVGAFNWDFVLVSSLGERLGPFIKGPFFVADNITQFPPT